ncbi:MAG: hypothetical protein OXF02_01075 [Simkaniaceae bacterium]|nr:hypothetical protein [Simkaniaceae bacterium]
MASYLGNCVRTLIAKTGWDGDASCSAMRDALLRICEDVDRIGPGEDIDQSLRDRIFSLESRVAFRASGEKQIGTRPIMKACLASMACVASGAGVATTALQILHVALPMWGLSIATYEMRECLRGVDERTVEELDRLRALAGAVDMVKTHVSFRDVCGRSTENISGRVRVFLDVENVSESSPEGQEDPPVVTARPTARPDPLTGMRL